MPGNRIKIRKSWTSKNPRILAAKRRGIAKKLANGRQWRQGQA